MAVFSYFSGIDKSCLPSDGCADVEEKKRKEKKQKPGVDGVGRIRREVEFVNPAARSSFVVDFGIKFPVLRNPRNPSSIVGPSGNSISNHPEVDDVVSPLRSNPSVQRRYVYTPTDK